MILDGSRDCKIIAKPLDGATTSSTVSRVAADSIYPPHCSSNATFPLLKQCTLRDDTPSTSGSQQMQTRLSCIDDMQADVNPSSDESPLNVMTSRRKIDSGHPNVIIRRPQPCGVKREVASLDGNYEYHVPDLKFKTYSVRASYAGQLTFPEASGLPAAVKKQTSLWSLTSTAGSLNPTYRNHCRADYSRGHIQSKDSPVTSLVNGGPIEPSKALVHRGDFSLHNERAPSVIGDFTKLSQSHPAPTLSGKSRVSSEISESETDATMSSPASDRVGSYCVMNNKLNVVTKL